MRGVLEQCLVGRGGPDKATRLGCCLWLMPSLSWCEHSDELALRSLIGFLRFLVLVLRLLRVISINRRATPPLLWNSLQGVQLVQLAVRKRAQR